MARLVYGDDLMFNAMSFGRASPEVSNFIHEQWNSVKSLPQFATSTIMQGVQQLTESIASSDIYQQAEAAINYIASLWGRDVIQYLPDLPKVQNAPVAMVPYLMAQPAVRNLYNKGACEGYGDDYIDHSPGATLGDLEEYRRVMNGVVQFDDDDNWSATTFYSVDDRFENVGELSHLQSLNIRDAWEIMAEAVHDGRDPTSRMDNDL